MTEPDVALTDYGLAAVCVVLAVRIGRPPEADPRFRPWLALFFLSLGLAALAGGTVHGFFPEDGSAGARLLWPLTLLAIGLTALAAWAIGARLGAAPALTRVVTRLAVAEWLGYAVAVLAGRRAFVVAIVNYLPAAAFLLVMLLRTGTRPARQAALGLGGTLLAALVQQAGLDPHPVFLTHNALAHVVQGLALVVFFGGARRLGRPASRQGGPPC